MVELLSALGGGNNTTSVHLEDVGIGLNGNGDWSLSESSLKLGSRSNGNILESGNLTNSLGGNVLAGSISGGVTVVGLSLEWVLLDVSKSKVHETTIATIVTPLTIGAVNELLLGE